VEEVMAEIDMNCGGTVDLMEFTDKLKGFMRERQAGLTRCRTLFDELDADQSGKLDAAELRALAVTS
jgi:Ca2+-binding EF-hand superfamily protein